VSKGREGGRKGGREGCLSVMMTMVGGWRSRRRTRSKGGGTGGLNRVDLSCECLL